MGNRQLTENYDVAFINTRHDDQRPSIKSLRPLHLLLYNYYYKEEEKGALLPYKESWNITWLY